MKTVKQMIEGWKLDIAFAGWTDTIGMTTNKPIAGSVFRIMGEFKANGMKIQVTDHGMIRMMQGNTVKFKVHGSHIALEGDKSWESVVTDHMGLSFGEGRQVYRSLCAILTTIKI